MFYSSAMDAQGRNELCNCRSGKKFKKCCGSAQTNTQTINLATLDLADCKAFPTVPEPARSSVIIPSTFPEARLFALLRALFGRPCGMMSLLIDRAGDPDAPFKYEFALGLPDGTRVSFVRSWLNLEVRAWGRGLTLQEVLRMLGANFDRHSEKVKAAFDAFEKYRLLANPHFRHRRMMKFFADELAALHIEEPKLPPRIVVERTRVQETGESLQNYMKQMERQNCFAVSLVTESAFTAESYLNLILSLCKNDTLRTNDRLFVDALRENWRDKVERLPLHCVGVQSHPDMEHDALKNAKRMFELRNRIVHSYPDPDALCLAKVWFDDQIPLLPSCESYVHYQCGSDSVLPTREQALECPGIVETFCAFLNELLQPGVREQIDLAAKSSPIGFSEATRKYGIPFGQNIFMSFLGGQR